MKLSNIIKTTVLGASILTLAGCISVPIGSGQSGSNAGRGANGAYGSNTSGVTTGGIGGAGYYLGSDYTTQAPVNQRFYFEFDSNQVHNEYLPAIKAQAHYLATHPGARVRLEGNTDARGSREYNIALGERRADAVAQLLELNGASRRQVTVISYGEERPAVLGHSEQAYKLNRRVHLIYRSK